MDERRRSVAPTSWKLKSSVSVTSSSFEQNSFFGSAAAAGNQLRRMFSIDKTREVIRGALEDSERVLYNRLACEHEELVKEWKVLRGYIQEMCTRYEQARSLDPIRRYKKMQSIAKTLILNFKLNESTLSGSYLSGPLITEAANGIMIGDVLQSSVKQKEMKLKHEKAGNRELQNTSITF